MLGKRCFFLFKLIHVTIMNGTRHFMQCDSTHAIFRHKKEAIYICLGSRWVFVTSLYFYVLEIADTILGGFSTVLYS